MLPSDGITGPPTLEFLIKNLNAQIKGRESKLKLKEWIPDWPMPATYLNNERWNDVFGTGTTGNNDDAEIQRITEEYRRNHV
jgi:hypothetical protein